jgi:oligopeptidase A
MSDNPLLAVSTPIPFDEIKAEHVRPAISLLLEQARERIEAIAAPAEPRTWENTLGALDVATEPLERAMRLAGHLEATATSEELREAYNAVLPEVGAFSAAIPLHAGLWQAIKNFAATTEASQLHGVQRRYLERTVEAFRRHGADLDAAGKRRLEEIAAELAGLTSKFNQAVVDATAQFEHLVKDEAQLAGLPPSAIAAARKSAESKQLPGWRFTLQEPSYRAVMTYLDDARVRRKFYRAYHRRADGPPHNNGERITRILELRREQAHLLGYGHFADFALAERMAKSGEAARAFLRGLENRTRAHFKRENTALAEFRRRLEGPAAPQLKPWDVAYYAEKLRRAEYDFDEEELRPYFPLPRVIEGLFAIVHRLFGVSFEEVSAIPLWHPDVRCYDVLNGDRGRLGLCYADWHPRETKRGGAWMAGLITGGPREEGWEPHAGLVCGNLSEPAGEKPALLTHREVETIFHEFGHLLHHLLSTVPVRNLAGTHVAWDFVELPSQIMENWCWEREALDLFARHWQSGETIPQDLYRKLRATRTFRGASAQMRQLGFGLADLALHIDYDAARDGSPVAYGRRLMARFAPAGLPRNDAMLAGFTHLFGDPVGYGAGYYSYKWAEVLEADAFSRFRAAGIFDAHTGREFRDVILARGDSEDPAVLFRRFMGRDPDSQALFERLGLAG